MTDGDDDNHEDGHEDGAGLWAFVTRTIRPLRHDRRSLADGPAQDAVKKDKKKKAAKDADAQPFFTPAFGAGITMPPAPAGAGLDRRSDRKLRQGKMEIDGRIDLHGMNREQAYEALGAFLRRGQDRGWRCVLVITGKGRGGDRPGVLRRAVPEWLGVPPLAHYVLRHYPARAQHGGDGALYVLLRRVR